MTMSFADQVRDAVASAERAADTEPAQRFRALLDEFVAGLGALGVGARLQPGRDARKLTLYLHPAHRPALANLMLTFFLQGGGIVVSGETSTSFTSADDLARWLLRYVQLSNFLETLDLLREQATLPVEARLRVDPQASHAIGDVVVAVSPQGQERLDAASKGSDVELDVERIDFPGNGSYAKESSYVLLESAGLFVSVDSVEPAGNVLRVKGQRA